jgi:hypothetical protein
MFVCSAITRDCLDEIWYRFIDIDKYLFTLFIFSVTVAPDNLGDNNGGVTSNVLPQPVPVESSGPVSSNVLAQSSVAAMVSSTPYISSVTTRPTTSLTSGKPQTKVILVTIKNQIVNLFVVKQSLFTPFCGYHSIY